MRLNIWTGDVGQNTDITVSEFQRDMFAQGSFLAIYKHLVWAMNNGHTVEISPVDQNQTDAEKEWAEAKKCLDRDTVAANI